MNVHALHSVLKSAPRLQEMLNRYAILRGLQIAQTVTQDRAGSSVLSITHDFLAGMLGTDRPSVSLAAAILQRKNMIEYRRGAVKILNRKRLEGAACECCKIIQQLV